MEIKTQDNPQVKSFHIIVGENHLRGISIKSAKAFLEKIKQECVNLNEITVCLESDKNDLADILQYNNQLYTSLTDINKFVSTAKNETQFNNIIENTYGSNPPSKKILLYSTLGFDRQKSFNEFLLFCKENKINVRGIDKESSFKIEAEKANDRNENMYSNLIKIKNEGRSTITIVGCDHFHNYQEQKSVDIFCIYMENPNEDSLKEFKKLPILVKDSNDYIWIYGCNSEGSFKLEKLDDLKGEELKEFNSAILTLTKDDAFGKNLKKIPANEVPSIIQEAVLLVHEEKLISVKGLYSRLRDQNFYFFLPKDTSKLHYSECLEKYFSEELKFDKNAYDGVIENMYRDNQIGEFFLINETNDYANVANAIHERVIQYKDFKPINQESVGETIQQKDKTLSDITYSFFKNQLPAQWKVYPKERLVGKYVGHHVKFFTMQNTSEQQEQAAGFVAHLKENGFLNAELKKANGKPSVLVDLTESMLKIQ